MKDRSRDETAMANHADVIPMYDRKRHKKTERIKQTTPNLKSRYPYQDLLNAEKELQV